MSHGLSNVVRKWIEDVALPRSAEDDLFEYLDEACSAGPLDGKSVETEPLACLELLLAIHFYPLRGSKQSVSSNKLAVVLLEWDGCIWNKTQCRMWTFLERLNR